MGDFPRDFVELGGEVFRTPKSAELEHGVKPVL
jgi:hypothetical protein